MPKINTIEELRAEQTNLKFRGDFLEAEIKRDIEELKLELTASKLIAKKTEEILSGKGSSILGISLGYIADFITEKVILRNSGLITKLVVPYIVKKTTSNLVESNKSKIIKWFGNLAGKLAVRKE